MSLLRDSICIEARCDEYDISDHLAANAAGVGRCWQVIRKLTKYQGSPQAVLPLRRYRSIRHLHPYLLPLPLQFLFLG